MEQAFLHALSQLGNVTAAAEAVGLGRRTVYVWREADPDFAARWAEATEEAVERMEQEAWRRATQGVDRPVYQGGKQVGMVKEYSDNLLIFLLKGSKPEKYRERTEISGPGGGPVTVEFVRPGNGTG